MASAGLLQIGAGLGYMRPSPLLRSERKRKQITLAANLQQHQDKLIKTPPPPLVKRRRFSDDEEEEESEETVEILRPVSPSALIVEKATVSILEKKKEIQPLDRNLNRWQKINKYVGASQQSTLMLPHFNVSEEEVARLLLAEEETNSASFLNIHLSISVGSYLDGDAGLAQDAWAKARDHLSGLFDNTDYQVARALLLMGGTSIFVRGEKEQGTYYLLLAREMCESLAMKNSDVYLRLLCYFALFELRKGELETMIQYTSKLQDALRLPFIPDAAIFSLKGNESFHFPKRPSVGLLAQNSKNAAAYARVPYLIADMLQGVASCLYCYKAGEARELVTARLLKCMTDIMKELADGEAVSSIPGGSSNPPKTNLCVGPSTYALDLRLMVTSLTADTLWQIGNKDLALEWAISFLFFARNPAFSKLLSPAILLSISVLDIFHKTGNILLLQAQLDLLRPLQPLYASLKDILDTFELRIKKLNPSFDLGLHPADVLRDDLCHRNTTTMTFTPNTTTTNPISVNNNNTISIPIEGGEQNAANSGNVVPITIPPDDVLVLAHLERDEDPRSGGTDSSSWISNLGDIEELLLKDFGFDD